MNRRWPLALIVLGACLALAAEPTGVPQPGDRSAVDELLRRAAHGGAPLTDEELERILAATPHEEVTVSLILAPVVVIDRRGRAVSGLTARDFVVEDQGVKRPISWFSEEMNRPFRLAVLLDVSESMSLEDVRRRLAQALIPLAREVGLMDRMMLLSFSDQGVAQLTRWSDRPMELVERALAEPLQGRTAIVDALTFAARQFPETPKERQAIVLVTDGMDNASELAPEDAVEASRGTDIPVYVLLLGGVEREIQRKRYVGAPLAALAGIAEQTGGRWFLVDGPEGAQRAAAQLRDDLRHQYWLAFAPHRPPDGRFRPITVKVTRAGARVRTRAGYR